MRYKRMKGFDVWDRAGFDTHGLPTPHAVEKKFGIKNKDEIPSFGMERYISECKKFCIENKDTMVADFKKLGIWMGFEDPYMTLDNAYIEGEWWLVKKAHERKRLYEGEKVMHWCPHCATALAKHELEYANVCDDSIFLKFGIKGKNDEYLVIWTTTPWTIPYNLGVMVNPDEEYVKIKVEEETWIVAAKLVGVFMGGVVEKSYEVLETIRGEDLEGLEYVHPLYEEIKGCFEEVRKESPNIHKVVLSSEYVDTSSGSGLVHMAPGCGPEDYEVGYRYKILPFNNLDENGMFPQEMGIFKGYYAKEDDKKFIEYFRQKGFLIESTKVDHEYPHCWRCHKGVVFRLTKQWFFKVEDLKQQMRELNKEITWQPDWAGSRQFDSWLENLRDNSITRQRYWGCPVPIWKCGSCDNYEVIGSVNELEEKSGSKAPEDLHIPYIDKVKIRCSCGSEMKRVPDILDVWVDAGVASWTCLYYPQREDLFNEWWPADFILEGKDQIRGWFNLLFVASMISMEKPSFKSVYMHGFINDAQGRKMSKSLGNYILPAEVIEKYGAETLRYYMICAANPGLDLNYNFDDMNVKYRNLIVLWNVHNYLIDYCSMIGMDPSKLAKEKVRLDIEERFILSRMNSAIKKATQALEEYRINEVPLIIEDLFLELSRSYIQFIREKGASGTDDEKEAVAYAIYTVLMNVMKMFSAVCPMMTEKMFLDLKEAFSLEKESIHLYDWPTSDESMIDPSLESDMEIASIVIQSALNAREKSNLGIRWPVKEIRIVSTEPKVASAVKRFEDVIRSQINSKRIILTDKIEGVKVSLKSDHSKIGADFAELTPKIIARIMTESADSVLKHFEKEGKFGMKIDGKEISILSRHIIVERIIPGSLEEAEFRHGFVYLNKERTPELDAEGLSREVMRRVQNLRKQGGLSKADAIDLYIACSRDVKPMLLANEAAIKEKTGSSDLIISEEETMEEYDLSSKEKIKEYFFELKLKKR